VDEHVQEFEKAALEAGYKGYPLVVTILFTPNYDCFLFTHHSNPIAPDSSFMTYLLRSQSA